MRLDRIDQDKLNENGKSVEMNRYSERLDSFISSIDLQTRNQIIQPRHCLYKSVDRLVKNYNLLNKRLPLLTILRK